MQLRRERLRRSLVLAGHRDSAKSLLRNSFGEAFRPSAVLASLAGCTFAFKTATLQENHSNLDVWVANAQLRWTFESQMCTFAFKVAKQALYRMLELHIRVQNGQKADFLCARHRKRDSMARAEGMAPAKGSWSPLRGSAALLACIFVCSCPSAVCPGGFRRSFGHKRCR